MESHDLWHLVVLGATLFGAAGLAILVLMPLLFEDAGDAMSRYRPLAIGGVALAGFLLVVEWLGVH